MFERFTDRSRRVLVLAQEASRLMGCPFIGTEHLLIGLIQEGEGVAAQSLTALGVHGEMVREKLEEVVGQGTGAVGSPPWTPRCKKVFELSLREALQLGHNYIGTEHLLLGLAREGEGVAAQVLVSLGADLSSIRTQVITLLKGYAKAEAKEESIILGRMSGAALRKATGFDGRPPALLAIARAAFVLRCATDRYLFDGAEADAETRAGYRRALADASTACLDALEAAGFLGGVPE